jgi:hypothetical protein
MPEGEIHPEQAHAINLSQHLDAKPDQEGQSEAVDMMNASSTAAPVPSLPPPGAGSGGGEEPKAVGEEGGEGERGLASMAVGMMMGKHSGSSASQTYSGQQSYPQQQQYGYSVSIP